MTFDGFSDFGRGKLVKGRQHVTMAPVIEQYQVKEKPANLLSILLLLSQAAP
jgi:hypothetical protein